ncbi:sulfotransferase [Acuticoccus sp. MNP-M23]|uniref:sulfotransferase family protein n=1 Tax=Acuticoccus sp. MNP-M23 TaxID=3072793 RepID=UPI0028154BFD|nr:sulfotransferase [Acuticoccus sp. MNP-M23]WMS42821.1 sulfotransferase [Acuticoccus sp. MNP-M23]
MGAGPDFIVTGPAMAGSRLLSSWLAAHPRISLPVETGPCALAPPSAEAPAAGFRMLGENSRELLQTPEAASAIAAVRPDCRIVLVLREPVARAFAHFRHQFHMGLETTHDFAAALAQEELRRAKGWSPLHLYRAGSTYLDGVRRFRLNFGPDRLLVILHEEIETSPAATFEKLCFFLGLWPDEVAANDAWPPSAAGSAGVAVGAVCKGAPEPACAPVAQPLHQRAWARFARTVLPAREPDLCPGVAAALARSFAPQVDAIEAELGLSLDPWRTAQPAVGGAASAAGV